MTDISEIPIRICKFDKLNNKELITSFKSYLDACKCCPQYPNCIHTKEQSAADALDIPHSEIIKLKDAYYTNLNKLFPGEEVLETRSWVLYVDKNKQTPAVWHTHYQQKYSSKQVSGICYLTETTHGTEYRNEYFKVETIPTLHHWFLWESKLEHRPKEIYNDQPRMVIATYTIFK